MSDDSHAGHVHCPRCGREMPRGQLCPACGVLTPIITPTPAAVMTEAAPVVRTAPLVVSNRRAAPSTLSRLPAARRLPQRVHSPPMRIYRPTSKYVSCAPAVREPDLAPGPTAMPRPALAAAPTPHVKRAFKPIDIWKRYLPPVRLVWIFLGILIYYGGGFASAASAGPLLLLPVVGIVTDLGFQYVRFPKFRIPDTAIATSLFLALIIWPAEASLALASVAVAGVGMRHFFRIGGHPAFNPAALGLTFAVLLFALPNSWHVGVTLQDEALVALLGAILIFKAPHTWRFPVFFFASYIPLVMLFAVAFGGGSHLGLIFTTEAIGSQAVFFAFFMVSEPRTAPSSRRAMIYFSILLGVTSAVLPILFAEVAYINALGMISPFIALFIGNSFTILAPASRGRSKASAPAPAGKTPGRSNGPGTAAARTIRPSVAAAPAVPAAVPRVARSVGAPGAPRYASARESVEH